MAKRNRQTVEFPHLFEKPLVMKFTAPDQSSDGGVLLLKAIDKKMRLTQRLAEAIRDRRQPGKVVHPIREMLQERIYGIACGYADANDAARLAKDGAMRLACEKRDEDLASQPTLSRLENAVTRTDLFRFGTLFTDVVLEREKRKRRRRKVRRITIDMDPTEDPTYGGQQLTFFNAYYDNWCYLPMVTTIQFDQEREQYLVAPVLRPGNAKGSLGAISILKRLVPRLRKAFPRAEIFVRLDGAFATPEVFSWLEEEELPYVVNMAKNPVLKRFAEPLLKRVRRRSNKSGQSEREYGEARYQAAKWKRKRRAVIKAEVVRLQGREPRDNPRLVITNLSWSPKGVYRFYRKRGDAENRIRELKDGLRFDLTSCTKFEANQFRNLLTAAAYALYQQLRYEARGTECERAQVWTLRERLVKIGVVIRESVRRIWIEAPRTYVWLSTWRAVAARARAGP
ncbi:MAG: IS1380 family transposase [Nitrospinota bacterium]